MEKEAEIRDYGYEYEIAYVKIGTIVIMLRDSLIAIPH